MALAFDMNGTRLLVGDQAGAVRLLTGDGKVIAENKQAHRAPVRWVGFGPGGSLFSGGEDKLLHRWPTSLMKSAQSFAHPGWVTGASFSIEDQLLTACNDGNLRRWRLIDGRNEATIFAGAGALAAIAGQPGSPAIATGGFNQTVGLWDVASGQAVMQVKSRGIRIAQILTDSALLLAGPGDRARFVIRAGGLVRQHEPEPGQRAEISTSPDRRGQAILTNGQVRLTTGRDTTALPDRHRNRTLSVCFGPGGLLFTGGADGSVIAWDTDARQPLNTLTDSKLPVLLLDFDRLSGDVFVSTGERFARLWNPATGQVMLVSAPPAVSARLGSQSVLLISADGSLRILDRGTHEETHRLTVFGDDETRPDWLLQTADGRYDGSETALRSVYTVQEFQKSLPNPGRRQVGLLRVILRADK